MRGITVLGHNPALDLSPYAIPEWLNVQPRGFGDGRSPGWRDGMMRAQVVVDEDHEDDLDITSHPVQMGAVIHDHAFKRPASVRCRLGWSNGYAYDTNLDDVRRIYDDILRLQARRLPFDVVTGKRHYQNMLVASLRTHTDQKLEYTLMCDVEFREIVLVGTSVGAAGVGAQEDQADPESTTPQSMRGPIQVTSVRVMVQHMLQSGIPQSEIDAMLRAEGFAPLPQAIPGPTAVLGQP
jgi:hypothetical protein